MSRNAESSRGAKGGNWVTSIFNGVIREGEDSRRLEKELVGECLHVVQMKFGHFVFIITLTIDNEFF